MRRVLPLLALWLALILALALAASAHAEPVPRIEVTFVLDSTGSMGPWIDGARQKIKAVADDLAAGDPQPDVRFGLVLYRDKGDAFVTQVHAFTKDIAVMRAELDRTVAAGGGDEPESVLEGLKAGIVEMDWSASDDRVVKLIYLVGDAPPHHYSDSPTMKWIEDQALARGIVIHTIACGNMLPEGQAAFEELARMTEGRPFRLSSTDAALARRGVSTAGASSTASLGAAVSGSARAYSAAAGVTYKPGASPPLTQVPLAVPAVLTSGLLGAELRWIADDAAWSDLWSAHVSLVTGPRPPPPRIDFARWQILVLGGADAGLALDRLESSDGARWATVHADGTAGVSFILIPADKSVVLAKGQTK